MGKNGDSACLPDPFDSAFRADISLGCLGFVDIILYRFVHVGSVAVFDQEIAEVGLAGIGECQEIIDLFFRELKSQHIHHIVHSHLRLVHPEAVTQINDIVDRRRFGIVIKTEDMVFAFLIAAGKFHAVNESRISFLKETSDDLAAGYSIVIGQREKIHACKLYGSDKFLRRVRSVGHTGMHMKIQFPDILHIFFVILRIFLPSLNS